MIKYKNHLVLLILILLAVLAGGKRKTEINAEITVETMAIKFGQENEPDEYVLREFASGVVELETKMVDEKVAGVYGAEIEGVYEVVEVGENKVKIVNYTGGGTTLEIPGKIKGKKVTEIGKYVFSKLEQDGETVKEDWVEIETLILPETLEKIGEGVFSGNAIKEVEIPSALREIGLYTFKENSITKLKLPKTLVSVGPCAFSDNEIVELEIDMDYNNIGTLAFSKNKITHVELPNNLKVVNGMFAENLITRVEIPQGVEILWHMAFAGNRIEEIVLPESLQIIGSDAFKDNELKKITIPNNVKEIVYGAFIGNKIKTVTLSEGTEYYISKDGGRLPPTFDKEVRVNKIGK